MTRDQVLAAQSIVFALLAVAAAAADYVLFAAALGLLATFSIAKLSVTATRSVHHVG